MGCGQNVHAVTDRRFYTVDQYGRPTQLSFDCQSPRFSTLTIDSAEFLATAVAPAKDLHVFCMCNNGGPAKSGPRKHPSQKSPSLRFSIEMQNDLLRGSLRMHMTSAVCLLLYERGKYDRVQVVTKDAVCAVARGHRSNRGGVLMHHG